MRKEKLKLKHMYSIYDYTERYDYSNLIQGNKIPVANATDSKGNYIEIWVKPYMDNGRLVFDHTIYLTDKLYKETHWLKDGMHYVEHIDTENIFDNLIINLDMLEKIKISDRQENFNAK